MMRENKNKAIFCGLFFVILCGFWLADGLSQDRVYSAWEKRMLAQKPQMTLSGVLDGNYETAYESWVTDQFPGRDWWVAVKTRCEILLGKKEIQGIYLGKDGYEFAKSKETAAWDELEQKLCEQFGREQVSRIRAPHAGAVLSDKVPVPVAFSCRDDAVFRALQAHKEEYIYYRTDHHWTMLGAYYAYEAWAREQGLTPVSLEQMEKRVLKEGFLGSHYGRIHYAKEADVIEFYDPGTECQAVYELGKSEVQGMYQEQYLDSEDAYRYFLDGNHGVVQIETGQEGGHLAVVKDSFANCLIPFLTRHYGRITVIDPRYFRADVGTWLQGQDVTEILILAQDTTEAHFTDISQF